MGRAPYKSAKESVEHSLSVFEFNPERAAVSYLQGLDAPDTKQRRCQSFGV